MRGPGISAAFEVAWTLPSVTNPTQPNAIFVKNKAEKQSSKRYLMIILVAY